MEFEYMQMLARKDARSEGLREGEEIGLQKGLEQGLQKGLERGRLESYASLVRDGILSLSDAAKRSGLSEEQLKDWMQQNEMMHE